MRGTDELVTTSVAHHRLHHSPAQVFGSIADGLSATSSGCVAARASINAAMMATGRAAKGWTLRHAGLTKAVARSIAMMEHLVPSSGTVVFTSYPDLEDNVVALLRDGHAQRHRVTVLVGDPVVARARARSLGLQVRIVRRNSARGLWAFLRSSVCVSTHGLFGSRPRPGAKQHLGLWHGEYIKATGRVLGEPTHQFDRMMVSGGLSRLIRSAETGMDPLHIDVTGVPRTDLMRAQVDAPERPIVLWAPTYRASVVGSARRDGDAASFDAFVHSALEALDPVLTLHDAELWLRLHPSAVDQVETDSRRVVVADDARLMEQGLTLYAALGRTVALVTDYSSLWVDYLHLDRPVIGAVPDLDDYAADRGLLLRPYDWWFPGPICRSVEELVAAVQDVLAGADTEAEHRRLISSILLEDQDVRPTDALWRQIASAVAHSSSTAPR